MLGWGAARYGEGGPTTVAPAGASFVISVEGRRGGSNWQTRRGWCARSAGRLRLVAQSSRSCEHETEQLPGPLRARVGVGVLKGKEGS